MKFQNIILISFKPYAFIEYINFFLIGMNYLKIRLNHTRDKPLQCSNCGISFWLKWTILVVLQNHLRLKSFCFSGIFKILASLQSFSLSKYVTPLYFCHRRGG